MNGCDISSRWRKIADSWEMAIEKMEPTDECRIRAEVRSQAYRDCADDLDNAEAGRIEVRDSAKSLVDQKGGAE
jgi:hypothetical protein